MKMKFDERRNEWIVMTRRERIVETAVEGVCTVFALVALVLSLWLYCAATPPQASAQCDLLRAEMEAAE